MAALGARRCENGSLALNREEFPRPQTTMEELADLKPAFAYPLDDKGRLIAV